MIKTFDLLGSIQKCADQCAGHASKDFRKEIWSIGARDSNCQDNLIAAYILRNGCISALDFINKNNLTEEEAGEIRKNFAVVIKRCDYVLGTAEYLTEVAQQNETQKVDPRIVMLLGKLNGIQEKISSGEFKKLNDTKLGDYSYILNVFNADNYQWVNNATSNSVLQAKALAKDLTVKLERIQLKNKILEYFNNQNINAEEEIVESEEGNGEINEVTFSSLQKMISLISSSENGDQFTKTTLELSKLDGLFAMSAEGKKENILNRIYYHLYHIHKNEGIEIRGIEKSDFKYGEKIFALNSTLVQAEKLRAVQRVVIELLLSELKLAIQEDAMAIALDNIRELEQVEHDTKDLLDEQKVAHMLFAAQYKYCEENDPKKYDCNAPEWGYEFGRVAFVADNGQVVSKEVKLEVLEKVITSLKQKWNTEDNIVN